jgi:hypothetical protein
MNLGDTWDAMNCMETIVFRIHMSHSRNAPEDINNAASSSSDITTLMFESVLGSQVE